MRSGAFVADASKIRADIGGMVDEALRRSREGDVVSRAARRA